MNADVTIVGAGILGLSLAYHLSNQGCSVVLLEREANTGLHASGKNAGMFRQLYRSPQLSSWARRSPALWPESIRDLCFQRTGSYVLGRKSPTHDRELFADRQVRTPSGATLDAVFCESDGLIDSARFIEKLTSEIHRRKVDFRLSTSVRSVEWESGVWRIQCEAEAIESPRVVLGNGAWVSSLPLRNGKENLNLRPELLQPYARYLFAVEGWPEEYMPEPDCGFYWNEADEWYLRRWKDGQRLLSICDRLAAHPDTFNPSFNGTEALAETLSRAFPDLSSQLTLSHSWHCFRTYTPDQLPVWGPDPRQDNLFWLAGFGGFGMSTGFAATWDLSEFMRGAQISIASDVIIERLLRPMSNEI